MVRQPDPSQLHLLDRRLQAEIDRVQAQRRELARRVAMLKRHSHRRLELEARLRIATARQLELEARTGELPW